MTPLWMSTRTAVDRCFRRLPPSLRPRAWSCTMCISRSPAWRTCFCTIREGACGNELEGFSGDAGARCARCPSQFYGDIAADVPAALDVCVHLRPRDGAKRIHARGVQESAAPWNHGHQHGVQGSVGGGDASDCRIPMEPLT